MPRCESTKNSKAISIRRLLVGFVLVIASTHSSAVGISLLTADYPPYYGPKLKNESPTTEIVTAAYEKVGYQVTVSYVPWARAVKLAKSGKSDGLHGTPKSENSGLSTRTNYREISLSFTSKGTAPSGFTHYEDLRAYRIGMVRGYRNPPEFDVAKLTTREADSDKSKLFNLGKGSVALILIDKGTAKFILANELQEYEDSLEPIEPAVEVLPLYLLFLRQTEEHQKKSMTSTEA